MPGRRPSSLLTSRLMRPSNRQKETVWHRRIRTSNRKGDGPLVSRYPRPYIEKVFRAERGENTMSSFKLGRSLIRSSRCTPTLETLRKMPNRNPHHLSNIAKCVRPLCMARCPENRVSLNEPFCSASPGDSRSVVDSVPGFAGRSVTYTPDSCPRVTPRSSMCRRSLEPARRLHRTSRWITRSVLLESPSPSATLVFTRWERDRVWVRPSCCYDKAAEEFADTEKMV